MRKPTPPEQRLYDAAEEYSRLKGNGGFASSEKMEEARKQLRWAARRFSETDTPAGKTLLPPHPRRPLHVGPPMGTPAAGERRKTPAGLPREGVPLAQEKPR